MAVTDAKGRSVDTTPLFSALLEPRSLVITTSELYSDHLHGIDEVAEDVLPAPGKFANTTIANTDLVHGEEYRGVLANGGTLKRDVRYSLTCRDVERVIRLNTRLGIGRR